MGMLPGAYDISDMVWKARCAGGESQYYCNRFQKM